MIIKLKNKNGFSSSSGPARVNILNKDQIALSTTTEKDIDITKLPSQPVIELAVYVFKSLFIQWKLENNGGSEINQINIYGLDYDINGPIKTFNRGNIL